jgi:hypothetical protein
LKQLIINGQTVGSIWKTEKPDAEAPAKADTKTQTQPKQGTPNGKHNSKHEGKHKDGGKKAAYFIPQSYADPTASAAIGNIIREQELEQRRQQRQNKGKRRKKRPMKS